MVSIDIEPTYSSEARTTLEIAHSKLPRTDESDERRHKRQKKPKKLKVKSPLGDQFVVLSQLDLSRKAESASPSDTSPRHLGSFGSMSMESTVTAESNGNLNMCQPRFDPETLLPLSPDHDLVFVPHGSGYKPLNQQSKSQPIITDSIPKVSLDDALRSTARFLDRIRRACFENVRGVYAGFCLLSLILLPAFNAEFPNHAPIVPAANFTTNLPQAYLAVNKPITLVPMASLMDLNQKLNATQFRKTYPTAEPFLFESSRSQVVLHEQTDSFRFVGFYSNVSMNVNYAMQFVSTFSLLGALEQVVPPASLFDRAKPQWIHWKSILKLGLIVCMLISYCSGILMAPVDYGLQESQRPEGGRYGMPNWQYNQTALSDPMFLDDLVYWKQLNLLRGVCGLVTWVLSLMIWNEYNIDDDKPEFKIVPI